MGRQTSRGRSLRRLGARRWFAFLPVVSCLLLCLMSASVDAQSRGRGADEGLLPPDADAAWRKDPYTRGEPEATALAGYTAMGRLPWGDDHSTMQIEEVLGTVQTLWVETAHFRVGSTLPEYKIEKEDKSKLQSDLKALKERLPRVKVKVRELDRWLRLHLYAMRLEDSYAKVQELLGVTDADFPSTAEEAAAADPFMGNGVFLGLRDKFCVLLLEKRSSLGRYGQRYGKTSNASGDSPLRLGFHGRGSLAFVTTEEFFEGHFANDVSLHTHLVFNITIQLLNGFKDYYHAYPRWVIEGLAYGFMREVDELHPTFSGIKEKLSEEIIETDWPVKVRKRVKVDYYPSAKTLMAWEQGEKLEFADHTMMWSRVDYLLQEHPEGFRRFLHELKAPLPTSGRSPTYKEVLARQDEVMQTELGFDADGFDEQWASWVLKTYPKR